MKILKGLRERRWIINVGAFRTFKTLNWMQRLSFLKGFCSGKLVGEYRIKGGKLYPDKTFYIIRHDFRLVGLFSMYISNAGDIAYAIKHGYTPVVDMENYNNCYLNKGKNHNAWEDFFNQPMGISLKDAYLGKNIILSPLAIPTKRPNDSMDYFNDVDGALTWWKKIAFQYMRPLQDIEAEAVSRYEAITQKDDKVLGISIRGTDYTSLMPPMHPIQPTVEQVCIDADKIILEFGYSKVFVNTEDQKIADIMKRHFGEKYICNERTLLNYNQGFIVNCFNRQPETERINGGREYLITQLMLSKTDALLASRTSGTVGTAMMPNSWKIRLFKGDGG